MNNIKLNINEIFYSIQGESTLAGLPCVFVRLQGCNLRCDWCDTDYAWENDSSGMTKTAEDIIEEISDYNCNFVCITGGEPLLQNNVLTLMDYLVEKKFLVVIETNGTYSLENINKQVKKIVDFKTPSSKMSKFNNFENIKYLDKNDEVKFIIADNRDFLWSKEIIGKYKLDLKVNSILLSAVYGKLEPSKLASWILKDNIPARLQLQLHKYIWNPNQKGV